MRLKVVADPCLRGPSSPQRPLLLGAFTTSVLLAAAALAILFLVTSNHGGHASPGAVACLIVLTVIATHSEEVFGDETAINASIVVVLAGVGISYSGGPPWIPIACGLVAGLHWHHIRDRAIRKLLVNTSLTTLSALAATVVATALSTNRPSVLAVAVCGLAAVMAYWLTDNVLVAVLLTVVDGRSIREHARELVRSETEVIPFALLGFVSGYAFVRSSPWFGLVGVALLIVATEAVVFHGREGSARRWAQAALRIAPLAVAGALLGTGDISAVRDGGALALLAVIAFVGVGLLDRVDAGFGKAALVLSVTTALVALPGDGPFEVALIVGMAACGGFVIRRRRTTIDRITIVGAAMLAAMAAAGTLAALPAYSSASLGSAVLAGVLASFAALLAWNALLGLTLILEFGRSIFPSVTTLASGDSALVLIAGVCGGGAGFLGSRLGQVGPFALVALFVLATFLFRVVSARLKTSPRKSNLSGDELVDVLRSALLDLPASRLPD
jgi:hypothetical protein